MSAKHVNRLKRVFEVVAGKRKSGSFGARYAKRQSDTIAFFYRSEVSELDTMIQTTDAVAQQRNS